MKSISEQEVRSYLQNMYQGVFSSESIESHLNNHVGDEFAKYTKEVIVPRLKPGARVLDLGSGFGSAVLAARNAGLDAFGVEIEEFEVKYARERLSKSRPQDDAEKVFLQGDARVLNVPARSLDAITCWNVLEHIEDCDSLIQASAAYLKPGGLLFIVCPNYMAWRQEAHYHVPWKPSFLLPKEKGAEYLRSLGRNPDFLINAIFYRTNWEVLGKLRQYGFELFEMGTGQSLELHPKNLFSMLRYPAKFLRFYNPFKLSVEVGARKKDDL